MASRNADGYFWHGYTSGNGYNSYDFTTDGVPTPAPTPSPSEATARPSSSPTSAPSPSPTDDPTASPSKSPTPTPSSAPGTSAPSVAPTTSPSAAPRSAAPTSAPSESPSSSGPTTSPTASPRSSAPMRSPTTSPTTAPRSSTPTAAPSVAPSASPTTSPTLHPCSDGSHGCTASSDGGICYASGASWVCACKSGYYCAAHCYKHMGHTCTKVTSAPSVAPTRSPTAAPSGAPASRSPTQRGGTFVPTSQPTAPTMAPTTPTRAPTKFVEVKLESVVKLKDSIMDGLNCAQAEAELSAFETATRDALGLEDYQVVTCTVASCSDGGRRRRLDTADATIASTIKETIVVCMTTSDTGQVTKTASNVLTSGGTAPITLSDPSASLDSITSQLKTKAENTASSAAAAAGDASNEEKLKLKLKEAAASAGFTISVAESGSVTVNPVAVDKTTLAPTAFPTALPTGVPTTSPTPAPTTSPSRAPSESPTVSPTAAPTRHPCMDGTYRCAVGSGGTCLLGGANRALFTCACVKGYGCNRDCLPPYAKFNCSWTGGSKFPTSAPTTSVPTRSPSTTPTASPSTSPSTSPLSTAPSRAPSASPSGTPTATPSNAPSGTPTTTPTAPTGAPSRVPTKNGDTLKPTSLPSVAPTRAPSSAPSSTPSTSPSGTPTMSPSAAPTAGPSASPTSSPTLACPPGKFHHSGDGYDIAHYCAGCGRGKYQPYYGVLGEDSCLGCPKGYAQPDVDRPRCEPCQGGRYMNATHQPVCKQCAQGTAFNGIGLHSNGCPECIAGRFQAYPAQRICKACSAGKYSNITAATSSCDCIDCAMGRYQPSAGAGIDPKDCLSCAPGYYGDSGAASTCFSCPQGYRQQDVAAKWCKKCPDGFEQTLVAQAHCNPCPNGTAWRVDSCQGCNAGLFWEELGGCRECPAGFAQAADRSLHCDACQPAYAQANTSSQACGNCSLGRYQNREASVSCKECPAGWHHAATEPADKCTACGRGQSQVFPAQTSCDVCTAGTYAASTGQVECTRCSAGQFRSASEALADHCSACPVGFFQRTRGKSRCERCTACQPGKYTVQNCSAEGGVACRGCAPGKYSVLPASRRCRDCASGMFQQNSSRTDCTICPGAYFQHGIGASACGACSSCAPGRRVNSACLASVDSTCAACALGKFSDVDDASECTACASKGEFTPRKAMSHCRACALHASSTTSQASCACKAKHFEIGMVHGAGPNATEATCRSDPSQPGCCKPCPEGVECAQGVIMVKAGFWKLPSAAQLTPEILACRPIPDVCLGSVQVEKGNATTRTGDARFTERCRAGHRGILCGLCQNESWVHGSSGLCINCEGKLGSSTGVWFATALGVTAGAVLCLALYILRHVSGGTEAGVDRLTDTYEDVSGSMSEVTGAVETIVPYLQRLGQLATVFPEFQFPRVVGITLGFVSILNFQVMDLVMTLDQCRLSSSHTQSLAVQLGLVPWFMLLAVSVFMIIRLLRFLPAVVDPKRHCLACVPGVVKVRTTWARWQVLSRAKATWMRAQYQLFFVLLIAAKFVYPGMGSLIFASFYCLRVGPATYLVADLSIVCGTDAHWYPMGVIAMLGLVLVLLGMPFLMLRAVVHNKRRMRQLRAYRQEDKRAALRQLFDAQQKLPARLAAAVRRQRVSEFVESALEEDRVIRYFTNRYKADRWWYFLLVMVLSLLFVGVLGLLDGSEAGQMGLALSLSVLQLMLPPLLRPHRNPREDGLAVIGGGVYFFCLLGGLMKMLSTTSDAGADDEALRIVDAFIMIVFMSGMASMAALAALALCSSAQSCAKASWTAVRHNRMVRAVFRTGKLSAIVPDDDDPWRGELAVLPKGIVRCSAAMLSVSPAGVRNRYLAKYRELHELQIDIMARSIQAKVNLWRRRQSQAKASVFQPTSLDEHRAAAEKAVTVEHNLRFISSTQLGRDEAQEELAANDVALNGPPSAPQRRSAGRHSVEQSVIDAVLTEFCDVDADLMAELLDLNAKPVLDLNAPDEGDVTEAIISASAAEFEVNTEQAIKMASHMPAAFGKSAGGGKVARQTIRTGRARTAVPKKTAPMRHVKEKAWRTKTVPVSSATRGPTNMRRLQREMTRMDVAGEEEGEGGGGRGTDLALVDAVVGDFVDLFGPAPARGNGGGGEVDPEQAGKGEPDGAGEENDDEAPPMRRTSRMLTRRSVY